MKTKEELKKFLKENLAGIERINNDWVDKTYEDYKNIYLAKNIDYNEEDWLKEVYAEYACELCEHKHTHIRIRKSGDVNYLQFVCSECGTTCSIDEQTLRASLVSEIEWGCSNEE